MKQICFYIGGLPQPLKALFGIEVLELETLLEDEHNQIDFQDQRFVTKRLFSNH